MKRWLAATVLAALVLCGLSRSEVHAQAISSLCVRTLMFDSQGVARFNCVDVGPDATNNMPLPTGTTNVTPIPCGGTITTGGSAQPLFPASKTTRGFIIMNLDTSEPMFVSFTGTASAADNNSYPIPAGAPTTFSNVGSFTSPMNFGVNTSPSIVAATTGHRYACTRY